MQLRVIQFSKQVKNVFPQHGFKQALESTEDVLILRNTVHCNVTRLS